MTDETATIKAQQSQHMRHSWHWLFSRLRDCVDLRGCRPEDDERLAKLYEDTYFECEFMLDPAGKVGPDVEIMTAFRENAELWLSACPADEHVVVLPRKLAEQLIAALPIDASAIGAPFRLQWAEDAGHSLLRSGAAVNRIKREEQELSDGERTRQKVHRWLDEFSRANGPDKARDGDV